MWGWDVIVYVGVGCDSVCGGMCGGWDLIVYVWWVGCDSVWVGGM